MKRLEQGSKIMEYFIQKFRRTTKGSDYERRSLIKEFKCSEDLWSQSTNLGSLSSDMSK